LSTSAATTEGYADNYFLTLGFEPCLLVNLAVKVVNEFPRIGENKKKMVLSTFLVPENISSFDVSSVTTRAYIDPNKGVKPFHFVFTP